MVCSEVIKTSISDIFLFQTMWAMRIQSVQFLFIVHLFFQLYFLLKNYSFNKTTLWWVYYVSIILWYRYFLIGRVWVSGSKMQCFKVTIWIFLWCWSLQIHKKMLLRILGLLIAFWPSFDCHLFIKIKLHFTLKCFLFFYDKLDTVICRLLRFWAFGLELYTTIFSILSLDFPK